METRSSWLRGTWLGALTLGLMALAAMQASAGHGGHGGARAPRVSAPHGGFKPPRMPRASAPTHSSLVHARTTTNTSKPLTGNARTHATATGSHTGNRSALATAVTNNPGTTGGANPRVANTAAVGTSGRFNPATAGTGGATLTRVAGVYPNTYTYGQGLGARSYRAYGYGAGYRNRYYGGRYGYGRSQGNNRAIIARLRSVQMNLASIDHDYQGHRVRAMHAVAMAIRQLSHRSMIYGGVGFSPGMGTSRAMGMGRGGFGAGRGSLGAGRGGLGAGRGGHMPQAQSDARMSYALRNLEGINMQLGTQASFTTGHARARGHVIRAIHELGVALSIR